MKSTSHDHDLTVVRYLFQHWPDKAFESYKAIYSTHRAMLPSFPGTVQRSSTQIVSWCRRAILAVRRLTS